MYPAYASSKALPVNYHLNICFIYKLLCIITQRREHFICYDDKRNQDDHIIKGDKYATASKDGEMAFEQSYSSVSLPIFTKKPFLRKTFKTIPGQVSKVLLG